MKLTKEDVEAQKRANEELAFPQILQEERVTKRLLAKTIYKGLKSKNPKERLESVKLALPLVTKAEEVQHGTVQWVVKWQETQQKDS